MVKQSDSQSDYQITCADAERVTSMTLDIPTMTFRDETLETPT